jgi:hypothetical protein
LIRHEEDTLRPELTEWNFEQAKHRVGAVELHHDDGAGRQYHGIAVVCHRRGKRDGDGNIVLDAPYDIDLSLLVTRVLELERMVEAQR